VSQTVQIVIQESNEEIITNVTDITAGKKISNKGQAILDILDGWNGAKNCGGECRFGFEMKTDNVGIHYII